MKIALPPAFEMRFATDSPRSVFLPTTATLAPSRPKSRHRASPIPEVPPVTNAARSLSRITCLLRKGGGLRCHERGPDRLGRPRARAVRVQRADSVELLGHLAERAMFLDHPRDAVPPGEVLPVAQLVRQPHVPRVLVAAVGLQDRIVVERRIPVRIRDGRPREVRATLLAVTLRRLALELEQLAVKRHHVEDAVLDTDRDQALDHCLAARSFITGGGDHRSRIASAGSDA